MGKNKFSLLIALCFALFIPLSARAVYAAVETPENTGVSEDTGKGIVLNYHDDLRQRVPESISDRGSRRRSSLLRTTTIPAKWDNNNFGSYMPPLRNQNPFGSCWAQSAMAMAEIRFKKMGYMTNPNFSEVQLAYFTYNNVTDPLGGTAGDINRAVYTATGDNYLDHGGSLDMAYSVLASWAGAADDDGILAYPVSASDLRGSLEDRYAYGFDRAHLEDAYFVNLRGSTEDIQLAKRLIMENGAIGMSYYAEPGSRSAINRGVYDADHNAYYDPVDHGGTNHAVTVVGWDDNFAVTNFNAANRPENPGAWLIRNSWTTGSFDGNQVYEGYFWLSYDNVNTGQIATALVFEPADNYDHNYQYDGGMIPGWLFPTGSADLIKGANVFCAHGDETLKAVMAEINASNASYTIEIYKGLPDGNELDLSEATPVSSMDCTTEAEGMYTVDLDTPVTLSANERFAVVVTVSKPGGQVALSAEHSGVYAWCRSTTSAEEGQSYYYSNGRWIDYGASANANIRIKALTDDRIGGTVDLSDPSTTITVSDADYTGIALTPLVTVKSGDTVINASNYDLEYSDNVEVGTGHVTVTARPGSICTGSRGPIDFTINPAPLSRVSFEYQSVKDGQHYTNTIFSARSVVPVSEIFNHYYLVYNGIELEADTDYELTTPANSFLGANEQPVTFIVSGLGRFTGEKEIPVFVDSTDISADPTTGYESTYDGRLFAYGVTATFPNQYYNNGEQVRPVEFGVVNGSRGALTKDVDYRITGYGTNTEPGDGTVTIEGLGNYTGSVTLHFTILPRLFVTVSQNDTLTYNGGAQRADVTVTSNAPSSTPVSVQYSRTADGEYTTQVPEFTDAGSHRVYFRATAPGFDQTATGDFEVTFDPKTLGITWNTDDSWLYDGDEHGVSATLTGVVSADTGLVSPSVEGGTQTHAGTYTARVTSLTGTKSENYSLPSSGLTKGFEITKRRVVMTSGSASADYHAGTALTCDDMTYGGDRFVDGEGVSVTFTGSQTAPGSSDNTFTYTFRTGTLASDYYDIETRYGTLTVRWWDDSEVEDHYVYVTANSNTFEYNGEEQTVTGLTSDSNRFTFEGETFTISGLSAEGSATAVGVHTVAVTGTGVIRNSDGETVTSHFTIIKRPGTLTITAKNLSSADIVLGASLYYTGSEQTQEFVVKIGSRTLRKDTDYEVTGDKATTAGEHTLTITGKGGYTGSASKNYTIALRSLTGVSVTQSETMTYNAGTRTPSVRAVCDQDGVAFTYARSTGATYTSEMPGFSDAGTHTVYYKAEKTGYNPSTGSFTVTIEKAKLGIQWGTDSFAYDGKEHVPTATATGVQGSDSITFTVTGAAKTAGTHTATVTGISGSASNNYELPSDRTKQYTITKTSDSDSKNSNSSSSSGSKSSTSSGSKSSTSSGSKSSTSSGSKTSASSGSKSNASSGNTGSSSGSKNTVSAKDKTDDAATGSKNADDKENKKDNNNGDSKKASPEKLEDSIRLADDSDTLKQILGEEKYKELTEEGKEPQVRLNVYPMEDVPEDEKKIAEDAVESHKEDIPNLKIGEYLDINLEVNEGGDWIKVSETDGKVKLVMDVTDELAEKGSSFWMLHIHGGESELLEDVDDDPKKMAYEVGGFSTFVLLYSEKEPDNEAAEAAETQAQTVAASGEQSANDTTVAPAPNTGGNATTISDSSASDSELWRIWLFAGILVFLGAGIIVGINWPKIRNRFGK